MDLEKEIEKCREVQREYWWRFINKIDYTDECLFKADLTILCISDWLMEEILILGELNDNKKGFNGKFS